MNAIGGYDIEDLMDGMSASFTKALTERDVFLFAGASGDRNPLHLDEEYAKRTPFGERIAHGMLSAAVISAAIAAQLPGPGSIYVSQNIRFKRPVKLGDTVRATVTITEILLNEQRVVLQTVCEVRGLLVVDGEAVVMPTSMARRPSGQTAGHSEERLTPDA